MAVLFFFLPFPPISLLPSQVCQRATDVREALDLMTLLNEEGAVHNMMDENFDFKQFQVNSQWGAIQDKPLLVIH